MYDQFDVRTFKAFNTINTVAAYCTDSVLEEAEQLCAHFEYLFSHTRPDSSLARVNQAAGAPVQVDPELAALLAAALGYCEATDGLFDVTVGPAVALWDFHAGVVPDPDKLKQACAHIDYKRVHLDKTTVQLEDPEASIVLGGVAKGYIADALVELLKSRGVEHGLVNLGGNAVVFGGKPDGSPWNVGLRVPVSSADAEERSFAIVQLSDASVVTSGIYERCFTPPAQQVPGPCLIEMGGLQEFELAEQPFYHHILDPHTGMPAETDLASVSLISERSIDGDGYTTALVIMGLDRARAFVEALPGCEAVFVTRDNQVYGTSGIGTTVPFQML